MKVLLALGVLCGLAAPAVACGIEGYGRRTDDSKVDGTATLSTSWNGEKAFPRDGRFRLELGSAVCGQSIEVYVNGYSIGRYSIPSSGFAWVNFTLKGSSDVPVR